MKATIKIDMDRKLGDVDPNIYGHFLSRRKWVADEGLHYPGHPDADEDGLRKEVVEAIREIAPPVVRWPGGCTGTSYDWREGVGPASERENTIDAHFGYGVSNAFGTDEFIGFCRQVGAAPHINLTTGTGSLREALAWVEYCNLDTDTKWANLRRANGHDAPFEVPYWQIGNEEWGEWEIGYTTADDYARRAREWAKSIKRLDPKAKTLALGHFKDHDLVEWNHSVLSTAGEYLDYLTFHRYWDFDTSKGDDQYDFIAAVGRIEEEKMIALSGLIDLVAREQNWKITPKIAFTEWNCRDVCHGEMTSGWRPGKAQYRLVDALAAAGFINAMQRQSNLVKMANIAQTINVVGILVVTDDELFREPVYWALHMQRHLSGAVAVDAHVECGHYMIAAPGDPYVPKRNSQHGHDTDERLGRRDVQVPWLDVSATKGDGKLFISIVNRHRSEAFETEISIGVDVQNAVTCHRLWHENPLGQNTLEEPDAIRPVATELAVAGGRVSIALPPHSYTILEIPVS